MPTHNSPIEFKTLATQDQKSLITTKQTNSQNNGIAYTQGFFRTAVKDNLQQLRAFPPELAELVASYLDDDNGDLTFLNASRIKINTIKNDHKKSPDNKHLSVVVYAALAEAAENCFRQSMIFLLDECNALPRCYIDTYNINILIALCCSATFYMEQHPDIKNLTLSDIPPGYYSLLLGLTPQLWCATTYNGAVQIKNDPTINTLLTKLSRKSRNEVEKSPITQEIKNALRINRAKLLAEAVKFLLTQPGADVNHVDQYGRTPLILATLYGNPYLVNILLRSGANPLLTDHFSARDHGSIIPTYNHTTALARALPLEGNYFRHDSTQGNLLGKFYYFESPRCAKLLIQYTLAFSLVTQNYPANEEKDARSHLKFLTEGHNNHHGEEDIRQEINFTKRIAYYYDCYKTIVNKKLIDKLEKYWDKNKSLLENTLHLTNAYLSGRDISGWRSAIPNAEFLLSHLVILEAEFTQRHSILELNEKLLALVEQLIDSFESASTFPAMLFWIESQIRKTNWVMPLQVIVTSRSQEQSSSRSQEQSSATQATFTDSSSVSRATTASNSSWNSGSTYADLSTVSAQDIDFAAQNPDLNDDPNATYAILPNNSGYRYR